MFCLDSYAVFLQPLLFSQIPTLDAFAVLSDTSVFHIYLCCSVRRLFCSLRNLCCSPRLLHILIIDRLILLSFADVTDVYKYGFQAKLAQAL
jgi:hypothetical protein